MDADPDRLSALFLGPPGPAGLILEHLYPGKRRLGLGYPSSYTNKYILVSSGLDAGKLSKHMIQTLPL